MNTKTESRPDAGAASMPPARPVVPAGLLSSPVPAAPPAPGGPGAVKRGYRGYDPAARGTPAHPQPKFKTILPPRANREHGRGRHSS